MSIWILALMVAGITAFLVGPDVLSSIRKDKKPKPTAKDIVEKSNLIRVGGKVIKESDWSPEVLAEVKKDYFQAPVKGLLMTRADITGGCPRGHMVSERVGVIAATPALVEQFIASIHTSRRTFHCPECGNPALISGKAVVWSGKLEEWDGAT